MPSTYSPNKIYELQQTGENTGTWGTLLNAVLSIIDLNLGGRLALNVAGSADVTLTAAQERNSYMLMTGVLTGNISLVFTATNGGFYLLDNRSTGSFTITAKPSGGTGVVIPQNAKCLIMIDPDNTRAVIMGTPNMLTTQGDILYQDANGVQRLAAGASGLFLKSQGAGANPIWAAGGGSGLVLLASGTVAAATLDIVLTGYTAYRGIKIFLSGFRPATDATTLMMRVSTDGGSNYDAGASDYNYAVTIFNDIGGNSNSQDDANNSISIATGIGNGSNEGYNGEITLLNQTSAAFWSRVFHIGSIQDSSAPTRGGIVVGTGARKAAQDTDAIRFMFNSGDITSGNYAVYGLA